MRIIAGQFKGRQLLSPSGRDVTRPMTGKVKESLFSVVQAWLPGGTVLDLYSGTGTMGLEALSRGASRCCFADRDRQAVRRLRENIRMLGVEDRTQVWQGDVETRLPSWLGGLDVQVDLAFLDPPYASARAWPWDRIAVSLFEPLARRLEAEGIVVLRVPSDVEPPGSIGGLDARRVQQHGDMKVAYYQHPARTGDEAAPPADEPQTGPQQGR